MKSCWNFEQGIDVNREKRGDQQTQNTDAAVAEQAGIDQLGEVFNILDGGKFRNIANHRGTYTKIKQAIVTRDRKNQNPDAGSGIAQFVQDEWVQQEADNDIDAQREPTGANILDDLPFVDTHRKQLMGSNSSGAGGSSLRLELDGADVH